MGSNSWNEVKMLADTASEAIAELPSFVQAEFSRAKAEAEHHLLLKMCKAACSEGGVKGSVGTLDLESISITELDHAIKCGNEYSVKLKLAELSDYRTS